MSMGLQVEGHMDGGNVDVVGEYVVNFGGI